MKIHYYTLCWGKDYLNLLFNFSLKSFISKKFLPLKNDHTLFIYTDNSSIIKCKTINELVINLIEQKIIEGESVKEIESDRVILEEFIEIIGDIDFSRVTKKEVSHYIDVQRKLPPNRKESPKYKDLTINELMELKLSQNKTQTAQNINKRLSKLIVFGSWGVRLGLLLTNPFSQEIILE